MRPYAQTPLSFWKDASAFRLPGGAQPKHLVLKIINCIFEQSQEVYRNLSAEAEVVCSSVCFAKGQNTQNLATQNTQNLGF